MFYVPLKCRYSPTPNYLPLRSEAKNRMRAMSLNSVSQCPISPQTPSPREVDAMLRNTFASTPSPLSQPCSSGGSRPQWSGLDSPSLSMTPAAAAEKMGVSKEERNKGEDGGTNVEREEWYVVMQPSVVWGNSQVEIYSLWLRQNYMYMYIFKLEQLKYMTVLCCWV